MRTLLGVTQAAIGGLFAAGIVAMLGSASAMGSSVSPARSALLLVCPLLLVAGGLLYASDRTERWGAALSAAGSAGVTAMIIFLLYTLVTRPMSTGLVVIAVVVVVLVGISDYLSYRMIR